MTRRLLTATVLLALAGSFAGCTGNREMEAEVLNLKNTSRKQFSLLKQQNEFMNRKVTALNTKVEELTKMNSDLSTELATFRNRPDEVKIEIINEVNTRFAAISRDQQDFKNTVNKTLEERAEATKTLLDNEFDSMRETLNKHTSFVQFVSTEQDSINRVFANRIDSRPWYQSIIGKWEDKERASKELP